MRNQRLMNYKVILSSFAFLIVIFHFSFFIFHLDKAEASALSLSLDPSIIEIRALAPSTATSHVTIQNQSDSEANLKIELRPFKAKFENGELEYLSQSSAEYAQILPIFKNIRILDNGTPIESLILGPGQQKSLTLNINILQDTNISRPTSPAGKLAGGRADYYFSIIFVSESKTTPTSNSSSNELGIASNILLSVGAKETPEASIDEFSSGIFFEKGPVPFTLRVENKGAHFIKPKGEILIKNMFGQSIGKIDLSRVNILSDSTRAISNTLFLQDLRLLSDSKTKSDLNFRDPKILWKENFLLGFYTATLTLSLSNEGPVFAKSIHFIAFPFQGMILIAIAAIAGIVIRNRLKAHMNK